MAYNRRNSMPVGNSVVPAAGWYTGGIEGSREHHSFPPNYDANDQDEILEDPRRIQSYVDFDSPATMDSPGVGYPGWPSSHLEPLRLATSNAVGPVSFRRQGDTYKRPQVEPVDQNQQPQWLQLPRRQSKKKRRRTREKMAKQSKPPPRSLMYQSPPFRPLPVRRYPETLSIEPRQPAPRQLASCQPASRQPASRQPASRQPASRQPASRQPASRHPASRQPASRQPASRQPASRQHASRPAPFNQPAPDYRPRESQRQVYIDRPLPDYRPRESQQREQKTPPLPSYQRRESQRLDYNLSPAHGCQQSGSRKGQKHKSPLPDYRARESRHEEREVMPATVGHPPASRQGQQAGNRMVQHGNWSADLAGTKQEPRRRKVSRFQSITNQEVTKAPGMKRLFIAIAIPDHVSFYLACLPGLLISSIPDCRSTPDENYHITLSFLGNQSIERVDRAIRGIKFPSFELCLQSVSAFPSPERPKVIFVDIQNSPLLVRFRERIVEALRREGISFDTKPFKPHVTIAKVPTADTNEADLAVAKMFLEENQNVVAPPFTVKEFVIMESVRRKDEEPRYSQQERYTLT